jgi:hypothetical protein
LDESKLDLVERFFSFGAEPANVSTYESVLMAAASNRDLVFAERRFLDGLQIVLKWFSMG